MMLTPPLVCFRFSFAKPSLIAQGHVSCAGLFCGCGNLFRCWFIIARCSRKRWSTTRAARPRSSRGAAVGNHFGRRSTSLVGGAPFSDASRPPLPACGARSNPMEQHAPFELEVLVCIIGCTGSWDMRGIYGLSCLTSFAPCGLRSASGVDHNRDICFRSFAGVC